MLRGKTALVCGGTSGIGNAVAKLLASPKYQANVIVAGRSPTAGKTIVDEMRSLNPNGSYKFENCDAARLQSITEMCKNVKKEHDSLQYLFMTQGIATMAGRTETDEGLDQKMVLHYYGRIHMTQELLPLMVSSPPQESHVPGQLVMSIFSAGKHTASINKSDLDLKLPGNYTLTSAAMVPGFYTDLALDKLANTNPGVKFIHAAPGSVRTGWGKDFPFPLKLGVRFLQLFLTAPEKCAESMVSGAFALDHTNFVLMNPNGKRLDRLSGHTEENMNIVWDHTRAILDRYRSVL